MHPAMCGGNEATVIKSKLESSVAMITFLIVGATVCVAVLLCLLRLVAQILSSSEHASPVEPEEALDTAVSHEEPMSGHAGTL